MGTVISKDGTPIAFDNYGAGPPVVLVGGAFQYRAFDPRTAELARLLSARFRVFHYDRRGRGGSGDTAPHAVQREVEDLQAIIAGAGGPRVGVRHVLWRGPGPGGGSSRHAHHQAGAVRSAFHCRRQPPPVSAGLPGPAEQVLGPGPPWRRGQVLAADGGRPCPRGSPDAVHACMAEIQGGSRTPSRMTQPSWPAPLGGVPLPAGRWTSVRVPALTVTGGKSPAWLHHGMQALTNILPRAENRILEGQTHMVKPEALAPVLEEFFSAGCGPAGETRHTQP